METGPSGVSAPPDEPASRVPAPAPAADVDDREPRPNPAVEFVGRFWAWLFLLVLVVFFSATGMGFLDLFNFQAIGANMAIMLIMALGQTFVIISGGIDLSTGFVMGLNSVGAALAIARLGPDAPLVLAVPVGLAAALIAGVPAGFVNGVLIARLRGPPFIGTLGVYGIARGVGFILSGGQPVSIQVRGLGQVGNGICCTTIRRAVSRSSIRRRGWPELSYARSSASCRTR
jgi:ribose transport system permease protein